MKDSPLQWTMADNRLLGATVSLLDGDKGKEVAVRVLSMLAFGSRRYSQHLRPFEVGAW